MKKNNNFYVILIFTFLFITSCSTQDESNSNNISSENSNNTNELNEYILPPCNNGYVEFDTSDNSFRLHLIALGYDTNSDGKISCTEALNVIELDLFNDKRIKNLKGIEGLLNLKKIKGTIDMNGKTANFFNNTKLEEITFNVFQQISYLSKIILPNSNTLKILDCSQTRVWEILNIKNQSNLEIINFKNSDLGAMGTIDLRGCSNLKLINFYMCHLSYLLLNQHLYLKDINIGNQSIDLYNNRLREINLTGLPALENLNLDYNYYLNQININNNLNLKVFSAIGNNIPSINLSNNVLLENLNLGRNLLININLFSNINLKKIYLDYNDINNINLTNNINLNYVQLRNNKLVNCNLKNGNNFAITLMNVTNNPNLTCIQIDQNFIPNFQWQKDNSASYSTLCN